MFILLIVYAVILFVFFFFPRWLKIVISIINVFVPDPVPFVDEIIMILMIFF